jgi:hypothetical protein
MKVNTKSSITLPPNELKMVLGLMKRLGLKTKVEVVRQALLMLKEKLERENLRKSYEDASLKARQSTKEGLADFDHLTDENI